MQETAIKEGIGKRARFDFIRYANCWEDADILLRALDVKEGGVYLSIASAGDNTLSLLSCNPSLVLAIDLSAAQLACLELRRAAFARLPYESVLRFLGVRESTDRLCTYRDIQKDLSADARIFWEANLQLVAGGIIHAGRFERYFHFFRKWVIPCIHGKSVVMELLRQKDAGERSAFYRSTWDTLWWRMLFRVFFSRTLMGRMGRDPEFFKYVKGDVSGRILQRAEYALTVLPTHDNPFLEYILTGNFRRSLPFYLREENFAMIRQNLGRLSLFQGDVMQALQQNSELRFDGFNLSDIFEYMSHKEYVIGLKRLTGAGKKGGRLVYWNMLADRKPSEEFNALFDPLDSTAEQLFAQDKAFFYKALRIERIQ